MTGKQEGVYRVVQVQRRLQVLYILIWSMVLLLPMWLMLMK